MSVVPDTKYTQSSPLSDPGFGIYVHWPFCAQKCPYCDFNSHVRFKGWDEERFLAAYKCELETFAAHIPNQEVVSIFFGGGTPSLMQGKTVAAIIDHIALLWPVAPDAEITLEANPGSVEAGRFRDYRRAGVNRVSIGVQSLVESDLKALGRIHSVAEAKSAVALAAKTFDRFSFDLIYARQNQTCAAWRDELRQALAMAGGHLSLYQLTIESGTPFFERHHRGTLVVPGDDEARAQFDITQELTVGAGLEPYEISNHARPGDESRHNLVYWRYGSYVGVGPGAHGRVQWDGAASATATERMPETWCQRVLESGDGLNERQPLSASERGDEYLMMALRLREGISVGRYQALSGRSLSREVIDNLIADNYLAYAQTPVLPAHDKTSDDRGDALLFGGEIAACVGPGIVREGAMAPPPTHDPVTGGRLHVTAKGRFVLNKIVYELATTSAPTDMQSATDCAPISPLL